MGSVGFSESAEAGREQNILVRVPTGKNSGDESGRIEGIGNANCATAQWAVHVVKVGRDFSPHHHHNNHWEIIIERSRRRKSDEKVKK